MKKIDSQTALYLPEGPAQNFSSEPNTHRDAGQQQVRPVPGAEFATRIRDFEAWYRPLPLGVLEQQSAFEAFYEDGSYYLALFHFSGLPTTALEALYVASAALGDHYLPAAEKALENAELLNPPAGPFAYLKGLLHISLGEYDKALIEFKAVAMSEPDKEEPLYQWTMKRKVDCQAILDHI